MITNLSFTIPGKRLYETENLVALHHPHPSYPTHLLILPKKVLPSLMDLNRDDQSLLGEVMEAVQILIKQYELEKTGYRLIVNGGKYQDMPQLHFHLISDG